MARVAICILVPGMRILWGIVAVRREAIVRLLRRLAGLGVGRVMELVFKLCIDVDGSLV